MFCVCIVSRYILVSHVGPWIARNGYISSISIRCAYWATFWRIFSGESSLVKNNFLLHSLYFFSILANPKLKAVFQKILWCFFSRMMTAWVSLSREYWHTRTLGTKLVMSYLDWLHQVDILDFQMRGVCSECLLSN